MTQPPTWPPRPPLPHPVVSFLTRSGFFLQISKSFEFEVEVKEAIPLKTQNSKTQNSKLTPPNGGPPLPPTCHPHTSPPLPRYRGARAAATGTHPPTHLTQPLTPDSRPQPLTELHPQPDEPKAVGTLLKDEPARK